MNRDITRPYPLAVDGLKGDLQLWLHDQQDQHVSKGIAETGLWEAYETQLLVERLFSGANFIDVGANIGYYTVIGADQVGESGFVAGFEPDPANYQLLQKNLAHNNAQWVHAVHAGLTDQARSAQLFLNDSNFGDHQIYDDGSGRRHHDIELVNGAAYLAPFIDHIDVLKIDTQGAESQVIKGLLPLLAASGDRLSMIIEFWPYGLRTAGSSAHQLLDQLQSLSLPFSVVEHLEHRLKPCSEPQLRGWIDMVDANPEDQGFMNLLVGK